MTTRRQPTKLGKKLESLRRNLYLNRDVLAERSGVSAHTIQSLEQGRISNPQVKTILDLARALDINYTVLIDRIVEDFAP